MGNLGYHKFDLGIGMTMLDRLDDMTPINRSGFYQFKRADRAARKGTNPSNGQKINIAASKGVRFQVGAKYKKHLN